VVTDRQTDRQTYAGDSINPRESFRGDNNYRPITICPVISKLFKYCILHKFNDVFTFGDMQFGFRKGSGCSHAILLLREVIDYFASHCSTVYMAALDARKAFDPQGCGLGLEVSVSRTNNSSKSYLFKVGPGFAGYLSRLNIGCDDIQWTDRLKYLGITVCIVVRNVKLTSQFLCGKRIVLCNTTYVSEIRLNLIESAANSILSKTKYVSEIVRLN